MKTRCAWHPKYFGKELMLGEKEPFDNHDIADGMCKKCQAILIGEMKTVKYTKCPHCGKKGLYTHDHTERCRYCDLKRILTPVNGW